MNYYALCQAKPPGCPSCDLDAQLHDRFYPFHPAVSYGRFPWYARARTDTARVFTDTMVLVGPEASHSQDIIRICSHLYIASRKFLAACLKFDVKMVDFRDIPHISEKGWTTSKSEYSAIIFHETSLSSVASEENQMAYSKYGESRRIKKLRVKSSFKEHLFRIENMEGSSNTLICSEDFRAYVGDSLSGVEFVDTTDAEWPRIKPI
ncbi:MULTISPECIES: hypothetical protein [Stenotrophomonas]|uniref:hypothetical protein n=1 Tax=Stenotrophomonas TaxID=40323 RepID=UPI001D1015AF|nr:MULTISPECIES: hypothetical protein [Stenotrophomonas]MCR1005065.1 hypothetical protein [Stenotrophomonas maltophilia]MCR1572280.1 hypothetical protein [Stenotrophomonas sp.]UXB15991.1 hypothetical protein K7565_19780 [Stenotrophomonas maltophilia]UXB40146.1 hypothetical protein K7569_20910 [Stenotrophomonas maltophilia]